MLIAVEPCPTAEATRRTTPSRTSPTAKIPGTRRNDRHAALPQDVQRLANQERRCTGPRVAIIELGVDQPVATLPNSIVDEAGHDVVIDQLVPKAIRVVEHLHRVIMFLGSPWPQAGPSVRRKARSKRIDCRRLPTNRRVQSTFVGPLSLDVSLD